MKYPQLVSTELETEAKCLKIAPFKIIARKSLALPYFPDKIC